MRMDGTGDRGLVLGESKLNIEGIGAEEEKTIAFYILRFTLV